ncbi:MAG: hypothetical protein IPL63_16985 [Saprospiraceae bacterium]|nr:hypothetical protein [Saprospiraceae bacterium]
MMSIKKWFLPVVISVFLFILNAFWGWWWMNGVFAFVISYFFIKGKGASFLIFFSFVFVFWLFLSIWKDAQSEYVVSQFLSALLGEISPVLTYILTGLTGGFFSGWAAYLGSSLRNISK